MNKSNLSLIGFLQALSLIIYCALISGIFWWGDKFLATPPGLSDIALTLVLLVFSAVITSSIIFGYPVYLILNGKSKEALSLFIYTLLYCLGIIGVIVIVFSALS
jgi:hypothetical protein